MVVRAIADGKRANRFLPAEEFNTYENLPN
jgi:hypothetical protein